MGTKSWNVKLLVDRPELAALLQHNLATWNAGSRLICLSLLAMRRSKSEEPGRAAWDYIAAKSGNWHLLYWLSEKSKPNKESEDVQLKLRLAESFVKANGGFDERLVEARCQLGSLWMQAIKASIERVKSYEAKLASWDQDHQEWIARRAEWEKEHSDYISLRPFVVAFQVAAGAARGSRVRWHKWQSFLCSTPEIVKWKNTNDSFIPLSNEEIAVARRNRRRAVRAERDLLFEKNPQLKEFDAQHGYYEREFARTYAKRKHSDGFRQRPTFTLPSLPSRPDWPRFQREQNWQALDLESNSIELRLLDVEGKNKWVSFHFVPDPRFKEIRQLDEPMKVGRTKFEYAWRTPSGHVTPIEPKGAKLISRTRGMFLSISFEVQSAPCRVSYAQSAATKYTRSWALKKFREENESADVVTCAVDLGIRHLGAISIAREGDVSKRRILHNRVSLPDSETLVNIPSLPEIAAIKRRLQKARRKSGKMSPEKLSCRRLQEHYRHMQEDRFKKAASVMCSYASHFGADFLIFEDLQQLVPDTANERGVNRALSNWNRGAIVDFATKIAEEYGLRVVKVPAYHTSRICSRCDGVGQRFDQGVRRPFRKPRREFSVSDQERRSFRIAYLGHWFLCTQCNRRIHADINASENLHRVFLGTFPRAKRNGDMLIVGEKKVNLAEVKSIAEKQLALATIGPTPF